MRLYFTFMLLFFSFLATNIAIADMDCGNASISKDIGNNFDEIYTMHKVRNLCGSPTKIKNWNEEVFNKYLDSYIKITIHYSMWTYDRGSNTFVEYLLFKDGILVDIKDGDYGSVVFK